MNEDLFGRLTGTFNIRLYACNLCGLSPPSEVTVKLAGDLPFTPQPDQEITDGHFVQKYATFYNEYFFFSDHHDSPKV